MTAITTTQITNSPEDFIKSVQGALRTTSLKVAEAFGKRHSHVLRKLDELDCPSEFTSAHFWADVQTVNLGQGAKRESRVIEMDKDGFMFLVMGFTGQKAAQIKVAYINAFNWMAEKLSRAPTNVDDRKPLNRAVRTLANLRSAQGDSADYAGMWKLVNGYLGVATIEDATQEQIDRAMGFVQDSIERETTKIIEGDYLSKQTLPEPLRLDIDYPLARWPEINQKIARDPRAMHGGKISVREYHLFGDGLEAGSPTMRLLGQLTHAGYDVTCCAEEVKALRHYLEVSQHRLGDIRQIAEGLTR